MNIEFVEFTDGYQLETDGKYMVRTISTSKFLPTVNFLQARCKNVWNEKRQKLEARVDVNNQRVTHISTQSI